MGQLYQTFTAIGVIFGSLVSNAYKTKTSRFDYQLQLIYCFIIPVGLFLYTFIIPERWVDHFQLCPGCTRPWLTLAQQVLVG